MDDRYDGLMNIIWIIGTIGAFVLLFLSLRLRLYVKATFRTVGVIILDSFTALNIIVGVLLGMISYARYAQHRFTETTWIVVISIWFVAIWVAVGRLIWWYAHLPPSRRKDISSS